MEKEVEAVRIEYPDLNDEKVRTVYVDQVEGLDNKP